MKGRIPIHDSYARVGSLGVFSTIVLILLISWQTSGQTNTGTAKIAVKYCQSKPNDTLSLNYYVNTLYNIASPAGDYISLHTTADGDGLFYFQFPVDKSSGRFFISRKTRKEELTFGNTALPFQQLTGLYFPEIGDDLLVVINERPGKFAAVEYDKSFFGKGSAKYSITDSLFRVEWHGIKTTALFDDNFQYIPGNSDERIFAFKLAYLKANKHRLSERVYEILRADLYYQRVGSVLPNAVAWNYERKMKNVRTDSTEIHKTIFTREYYTHLAPRYEGERFPDEVLLASSYYAEGLIKKIVWCDFILKGIAISHLYDYLKKNYRGELRDRLLTTYFLMPKYVTHSDLDHLGDAVSTVKSPYCLKVLRELYNNLRGTFAPAFSLRDVNGNTVSLKDFKGKVVFIHFWFTGCGACRNLFETELANIEDHFSTHDEVIFVSVSIDRSPELWKKSVESGQYTSNHAINLLADPEMEIVRNYNVQAYPTLVLIDQQGKVFNYNQAELYSKASAIKLITEALHRSESR